MKTHRPALGADEAFDPLGHIDPCSRTFYRDAAAAAAYLINGEGHRQAFGRCVLTAAIMHHTMQAARENRTASLAEVHSALSDVSHKIRRRTPNHSPREARRDEDDASKESQHAAASILCHPKLALSIRAKWRRERAQ